MQEPLKSTFNTKISRRKFLVGMGSLGASLAATSVFAVPLRFLDPMAIENPLAGYPNRDWEKTYRNIFKTDSTFVFLCSPNDTHNCLLKAHVKNGIVTRILPTYGYGKAKDLEGNQASHRWEPRICNKGLALGRRIYGDRRVKSPMIRKGFKEWVDAGFPRDPNTGKPDAKYFQRGKDSWMRLDWDEASKYSAKALKNIATTYSGKQGTAYLESQGYDPDVVKAVDGAGVRTLKFRGGMAFLGATRIYGIYRFANMMVLLDSDVRGVGPDKAVGARGWDSYTWHTDLPPGHPMVTGQQTNDFDLFAIERAKVALIWGMNWITTKMPDSHWMTEARLKGTKIISITVEYSATASKSDDVFVIRPGTDPAFALSLAQVILAEDLLDKNYVAKFTDLPFLIRMDTLQPLRPEEFIDGYVSHKPKNLQILKKGEEAPVYEQKLQFTADGLAGEFKDFTVFDEGSKKVVGINRDQWAQHLDASGIQPKLKTKTQIKLLSGETIEVRSVLDLTEEYLNENLTPELAEKVTGAPAEATRKLARTIAENPEKTLFCFGMGPNQFFNADLKDRAAFLVAALTRNIGYPGGNVGSYAGNYRIALFSGISKYGMEDPFNIQLDPKGKVKSKYYMEYESLHYLNYGNRPLRIGTKQFTGKSHMPTPTKVKWQVNSNSSLGNIKWHYDFIQNTLPQIEMVCYTDWWWTASCEYSDIVFACDSWAEFKHPDMTASCTNPFLQVHPRTPLQRIFNTRHDIEIMAGVAKALAEETGDKRFADAYKFVEENNVHAYLQRILDSSAATKGHDIHKLEELAKQGIPALLHPRTYPRVSSYEQSKGEQPWHTKSGRLEFYRPEVEFIEAGENIIVHREPIDSTHYEPNVILAKPHAALRPLMPEDFGISHSDLSCEVRQVRNVMLSVEELINSKHPLKRLNYSHVYHTPKYRHGTHTMPIDTDQIAVWFGPFGDIYRQDKRKPFVSEGYMDINPIDARELELNDGDYVWVDADPEDRPYRGWKEGEEAYKVSRLMLRVRFYPGTPRGIARTWYNMYMASYGSVKGHETREDGLAKNPETNYQSMFRYGGHQSATRAWLKPTQMTETLIRKNMAGESIGIGFAADIHCPVGAPREAFVKITKAEDGGLGGKGQWRPISLGIRPTYESEKMKQYLKGDFIKI